MRSHVSAGNTCVQRGQCTSFVHAQKSWRQPHHMCRAACASPTTCALSKVKQHPPTDISATADAHRSRRAAIGSAVLWLAEIAYVCTNARADVAVAAPDTVVASGGGDAVAASAATVAAQVLHVGPQQQFQTISAAIAAASPGSSIIIQPGRYIEQVIVNKSISLVADSQQAGAVELVWETQQPYQHCLAVPADCSPDIYVRVQNITFSHYSKSVANNYCIFAEGGLLQLEGCNISSRSGVGVGVEGGQLVLQQCRVHDCHRHGVGVFGALEGGAGSATLEQSVIEGNKLNGVLVRDGGQLRLTDCKLVNNGGYGMQLQDCTASLHGNNIAGNRLGSVAVDTPTVVVEGLLAGMNSLDVPVSASN